MKQPHFLIRLNSADYITLTGLIFSSTAVICALRQQLFLSVALLFLAMLADALDGIYARYHKLERTFGRYLDGFMDQILYLIVPALVFYLSGFNGIWSLFLLLMIACGSIRLAVFNEVGNIDGISGMSYPGMPVFWSLFILSAWLLLRFVLPPLPGYLLLSTVLFLFSMAMLWRRPFYKFKRLSVIIVITLLGSCVFALLHFRGFYVG
ncbi:CDP-diacylglycerol--serine O-phosphatidyltransferase [Enterobacter hormaechei subsp. hoffmannii]|uniref:CDP-alcohol phosphatidyltransferase family protein n=1 Tax=Enterobacter hormaechei TaxID=158836 RepID=UPI000642B395|nr:CDP-alcohol phosphatidyltransferase family protein [Enterobacter hormaechei]KLR21062.1 CDP-diacylglycerol--serine O-phosphatidyltransferase [Enterobacter hormaechei subsp. hoffmannii]HEM8722229.1 CDP-alcohol phosphatidyltransferase family protein [Enterobacter hormaechei]